MTSVNVCHWFDSTMVKILRFELHGLPKGKTDALLFGHPAWSTLSLVHTIQTKYTFATTSKKKIISELTVNMAVNVRFAVTGAHSCIFRWLSVCQFIK